jgi:ribosomal protein S2
MRIPVVALAGSDSNLYEVDYAIPGNDASRHSIEFVLNKLVEAYKTGRASAPEVPAENPKSNHS